MSNTKTVMGQAANTLVKPTVNVEDVFSTYLYEGNNNGTSGGPNPTRKITNGINLLDEGGLVWFKDRDTNPYSGSHRLMDSERSTFQSSLSTNETDAETNLGTAIINSVQDDGFTLGYSGYTNYTGDNHASWTFRKAPKFFDVVTYTGTGSAQNISHNLGSVPGCIITKRTDASENWHTYHRGLDATAPEDKYVMLNNTNAVQDASTIWNDTAPTRTEFTVGSANTNTSGGTYVAYLFAHNDGDGGFGPDGDADIIKCGVFTDSPSGGVVDLGWEPQWVLVKNAEYSGHWFLLDNMRGYTVSGVDDKYLLASASGAEATYDFGAITSTGFTYKNDAVGENIYIAIRRGTKVPESGTEVFEPAVTGLNTSGTSFPTNFTPDYLLASYGTTGAGDNWYGIDRLRGGTSLSTNLTDAETSPINSNYNLLFDGGMTGNWTGYVAWLWKRAPGFFDVVAYTGTGSVMTVSHNLGVAPEMMWVKCRSNTKDWAVYHSDVGSTSELRLNDSNPSFGTTAWNNTAPTDSVFTLGVLGRVNSAVSEDYIAYLFASLPGISKVGSYTGNGGSQTIDCGFTSGARFIIVKRTDYNGDWWVSDTARGIVAGNDALINLNTTSAEVTSVDVIDPNSSGFTVDTTNGDFNDSGASYIFYAIA